MDVFVMKIFYNKVENLMRLFQNDSGENQRERTIQEGQRKSQAL